MTSFWLFWPADVIPKFDLIPFHPHQWTYIKSGHIKSVTMSGFFVETPLITKIGDFPTGFKPRARGFSVWFAIAIERREPIEDTFPRYTRDLSRARFRNITARTHNGPVNSDCETRQRSTSCHGDNWHEQAPANTKVEINGSCFRSAIQSIQSTVLLEAGLYVTAGRHSPRSSDSLFPDSSIADPQSLPNEAHSVRTRYTQPEHPTPLSNPSDRQALKPPAISPPDLFYPSVAVIHFGNEPLIGNCVELHPRRAQLDSILVLLYYALLDGIASSLAWNEQRRALMVSVIARRDVYRYGSRNRLDTKRLEAFEMRFWRRDVIPGKRQRFVKLIRRFEEIL